MFARMSVGRPARLRRQPAFAAIETTLRSWTVAIAKRLTVNSYAIGRYDRALVYANVAADDESDAEANELIVRSLAALGSPAERRTLVEMLPVGVQAAC